MWNQLALSVQNLNGYILMIFALGFIGSVIMIERFVMLQVVYYIDFAKFLANFKKIIQAEDLVRAINLCKSASHTSLPHISLKAIEAAERDPTTVRGTIEEETIDFLPKIESRLSALPALTTLILLIGVLGTLDGLWEAFASIEVLDTAEKQARLSQGIAGSLNPTALALILCMVFLSAYQLLKSIAVKLTERIHYGITILVNLLVPQEVGYIAQPAMAAPMAPPPAPEPVEDLAESDDDETEEEEEDDDSFDDAAVEDIKDEEEII